MIIEIKKVKSDTIELFDASKFAKFYVSERPTYSAKNDADAHEYAVIGRLDNGNILVIATDDSKEKCKEYIKEIRRCYIKGDTGISIQIDK